MSNSLYSKEYGLLVQLLRELRRMLGVTQMQLASRLEKTQAYVSKCERCERRLDFMELIDFCEALDVDPRYLIDQYFKRRAMLRDGRVDPSPLPVREMTRPSPVESPSNP